MRIDRPIVSNHEAGWLGFAPTVSLCALGDGGSGGDSLNNAQNTDSLLGKILRLEIRGDDFPGDVTRNYAMRSPPTTPRWRGQRRRYLGAGSVQPLAAELRSCARWRQRQGHDDLIGGTGTDIRNGDIGLDTLSGDHVADDLDVITLSNGASIGPNDFLFA